MSIGPFWRQQNNLALSVCVNILSIVAYCVNCVSRGGSRMNCRSIGVEGEEGGGYCMNWHIVTTPCHWSGILCILWDPCCFDVIIDIVFPSLHSFVGQTAPYHSQQSSIWDTIWSELFAFCLKGTASLHWKSQQCSVSASDSVGYGSPFAARYLLGVPCIAHYWCIPTCLVHDWGSAPTNIGGSCTILAILLHQGDH